MYCMTELPTSLVILAKEWKGMRLSCESFWSYLTLQTFDLLLVCVVMIQQKPLNEIHLSRAMLVMTLKNTARSMRSPPRRTCKSQLADLRFSSSSLCWRSLVFSFSCCSLSSYSRQTSSAFFRPDCWDCSCCLSSSASFSFSSQLKSNGSVGGPSPKNLLKTLFLDKLSNFCRRRTTSG